MTRPLVFSTPQEWLEHFAQPVPESGCWLFNGFANAKGQGRMSLGGKDTPAARVSYIKFYGSIPKGLSVCHHCDVPLCINPKHLFVGTNSDNMRDMFRKGREAAHCKKQTHCIRGHELTHRPGGQGECRICGRMYEAAYQARKRGLAEFLKEVGGEGK